MEALDISGVWLHKPVLHGDPRGAFSEQYRRADLEAAAGHGLDLAQVNCSSSKAGVVRGIHFADVPPSQAKYVTCVRGAIIDVAVDIRVGSPTFGQHVAVRLDSDNRHALYIAEGLGHAFMALEDDSAVVYLCSTGYAPGREHGIHPLDPAIGIAWPADHEPLLSDKDAAAPTLAEAEQDGLLPSYDACLAFYASLAG